MTRLTFTLATLATVTLLAAAPPASADPANIRLVSADAQIRVDALSAQTVVKKTVVTRAGRRCRTVTQRTRVGGRVVVRKVRRCT
jgi:hypothetical protein